VFSGKGLWKSDMAHDLSYAPSRLVCQQVVHALITRHGWTLLPADELVELVLQSTQAQYVSDSLERLVTCHYAIALHAACRLTEDLAQCERGYTDLFRYLHGVARRKWPDIAEDVAQRALALIHEQIDRCREPAAFLTFALFKLRHAAQLEQHAHGNEPHPTAGNSSLAEAVQEESETQVLAHERLHVLLDAIRRLPDERKRQVLVLRFFGALSDEEISVRLGIKVNHVRKLRFDALKQLRKDRLLKEYFERTIGENLE
jgi:RNA polymerase sigma factor (sigma-70 family)